MNKHYCRVFSAILAFVLVLSCLLPATTYAQENSDGVEILVDYIEGDEAWEVYNSYVTAATSRLARASTVDLSKGADNMSVGELSMDQKFTTPTYSITKTKITVSLLSGGINSNSIRVTLYNSSGVMIGTKNVSIPSFSSASMKGATVTFTNLSSSVKYYIVIQNLDTATSGSIIATVKQG